MSGAPARAPTDCPQSATLPPPGVFTLEIGTSRRTDRNRGRRFHAELRDQDGVARWGTTVWACMLWDVIVLATRAREALRLYPERA